ncbi:carbon-nitrogen hydrolase family protein [Spirosoma radiotolerans]|uniref:Nitrilase n=1 Tax=Spirosoma radiotolerans TaxID=1379870 RepID=A0A0E3ZTY2_9BACT|nr:carbon-nitrogen hydrolase family protein [Spirosoma radiotolerans]AKD55280.1 nitrilase [Spirosoma radiotolerans]
MQVKVGVVQATPVFFDSTKTIDKLETLVADGAKKGCQFLLFPESFIPGYPRKFTFGATIGLRTDAGRELYKTYWQNSVQVPSPEVSRLEQIARDNGVYLAIGITERDSLNGSLYCTLMYISPTDGYLGKHQKIKPTGVERLVWAEGTGKDSLQTFDTTVGRMGGLICWENYMPLARMRIYQQAPQLYLAPTADARQTWPATLQHIACEGRCFVLGCNQYFTRDDYPEEYQSMLTDDELVLSKGGSAIVSPQGEFIAGPLWNEEGILIADLDLDEVLKSKLDFDVIGHYSRPDLFTF